MSFASSIFGRRSTRVLLLDISSASVGGVIVDNSPGEPKQNAKVTLREEIALQEDVDYRRFLYSTLGAAERVANKVIKDSGKHVDEIHCVLGSPWFVSHSRVINYTSPKPVKVTSDLLRRLVQNDIERFKNEELANNELKLGRKAVTLEVSTTSVRLNGYETKTPFDKEAEEICINIFISLWSEDVMRAFTETLKSAIGHDRVYFHTFPSVALGSISEVTALPEKYLFIDVSGEITDILTIEKNALAEISSFPLGRNFVVRWLTNKTASSPEQALSLLSLYFEGKLNDKTKEKIEGVVEYVKREWISSLLKALEKSSYEYLLPRDVYLIARTADIEHIFAPALRGNELSKFIRSNKPFNVTLVDEELLGLKKDPLKKVPSADLFLHLETLFINKLFS